jgi:glycosyltransferase involved in cell wall biosynthesis
VAPLRFGAGVKVKVLQSFASGVPCVMSEVAAEGLALPHLLRGLVGKDAQSLADIICRMHADEAANREVTKAGIAFVKGGFSAEVVTAALQAAIEGRESAVATARLVGVR